MSSTSFQPFWRNQITEQGLKPGLIVPLCIKKSKRLPVAMVAIMKTGGVSIAFMRNQSRGSSVLYGK